MSNRQNETNSQARDGVPGWERHARVERSDKARSDASRKVFARKAPVAEREFALVFAAIALLLFLLLPHQTEWVGRSKLYAQPAFWPAISLAVMGLCACGFVIRAFRSEVLSGRGKEIWQWIRSLEFVGWFIAYVWSVPIVGYLIATILFSCLLAWRVGYRKPKWMGIATLFSLSVVVLFKAALGVNIPAGALYELLPAGDLRSFLMTNL